MTTGKCIDALLHPSKYWVYERVEAVEQAAKELKKLQEIEEIVKKWHYPTKITTFDAMEKICEVLNGK